MEVPGWRIVAGGGRTAPYRCEGSIALHDLCCHSERACEEEVRISADAALVLAIQSPFAPMIATVDRRIYPAAFGRQYSFARRPPPPGRTARKKDHRPGTLFAEQLAASGDVLDPARVERAEPLVELFLASGKTGVSQEAEEARSGSG